MVCCDIMAEVKHIGLYDGEVNIMFYPVSHRYRHVGGGYIPSPSAVCGILDKPALLSWATRMMRDNVIDNMRDGQSFTRADVLSMLEVGVTAFANKRQREANVGLVVHHYAETGLLEYDASLDGEINRIRQGISAFDEWQKGYDILDKEGVVYHKRHDYAGTFDAVVKKGNDKWLVDYKTSSNIYPEHVMQVAAYMRAWEWQNGEQLKGGMVVRFDKETGLHEEHRFTRRQLSPAFQCFLSLLKVYRIKKRVDKLVK